MAENEYITRPEHSEFAARLDAHNKRQDARLDKLESLVADLSNIAINVERLATNMETMCTEQQRQGERLNKLEDRDGSKWRDTIKYITTTIIGIAVGYLLKQIGIF